MSDAIDNLEAARNRAASIRPKVGGFAYLAETLRRAGVTGYQHVVPAATGLYLTDAGPVVTQASPIVDGIAEVAPWNRDAVIAAAVPENGAAACLELGERLAGRVDCVPF
ncbi:hypothetical protein [Mycobacterium decipiens]|nr:hypothetical protein [Mycobacterium decipiens]